MKKIPMFFALDFDVNGNRTVSDVMNDKAIVLFESDDVRTTVKIDGTAMKLFEDGRWFARRNVKRGKNAPVGFILEEEDTNTGNRFGWEPVESSGFYKFFKRAIENYSGEPIPGTYELIGPKIQGNPERVEVDMLIPHGSTSPQDKGFDFPTIAEIEESVKNDTVKEFLTPYFETFRENSIEGVVWWVGNEPRVKLRCVDFFPEMDSRNTR